MGDLILALIPGEWLAAIGVAVTALAAVWFGGRKSAKSDAKADALKSEVEAHEIRNEVDNRIARDRDVRQRLRDEWSE